MASSFDEFIQLINYSRNPGSLQALGSVENLNQITDRIFSSPDFFFYILQIYNSSEPQIRILIQIIPSIIHRFFVKFNNLSKDNNIMVSNIVIKKNRFFDFLKTTHPEYLEYMTNMVLQNQNIDSWFCKYLWVPLYITIKPPGVLQNLFRAMLEIFNQCSTNNYNDPLLFQKGIRIFQILGTVRRIKIEELGGNLEQFLSNFFIQYFTPDKLENEALADSNLLFLDEASSLFRFSFDYFYQEKKCISQFFDFINYLSMFGYEKPVLQSRRVTSLFQEIVYELNRFINWVASPVLDRFPNERLNFIKEYFIIIIQKVIPCLIRIENSFPCDENMIISHRLLILLWKIIETLLENNISNDFLSQCFDSIYQLCYIYSDLPAETNRQYHINPVIYFYSAYCPFFLSEYEPRSFSHKIIKILFEDSPQKIIQLLLNSPLKPGLMYLLGTVLKKMINIYRSDRPDKVKLAPLFSQDVISSISAKVQQLIGISKFDPDILILKSQSLFFLPTDQTCDLYAKSFQLLAQTNNLDDENFTSEGQFLFTLGCRIVKSILTLNQNSEVSNILQGHITYIVSKVNYCITNDAIKAISLFYGRKNDIILQNGAVLLNIFCGVILKLTDNFSEDVSLIDKKDYKIIEAAQSSICRILSIKGIVINRDSFINFLQLYFSCSKKEELSEFVVNIMKTIGYFAPLYSIDILTMYFQFCVSIKLNSITDYFADPFKLFIANHKEDFINWNQRDSFIMFCIQSFCNFFNEEIQNPVENEFDGSYFMQTLVTMFLLIPDLLSDEVVGNLVNFALQKLAQRDNYVVEYSCFNVLTAVMYTKKFRVPDEVLAMMLRFMHDGFVFRVPEKTRYLRAITATRQLYSEEANRQIDEVIQFMGSDQFRTKENEIHSWIVEDILGINGNPPFGFE